MDKQKPLSAGTFSGDEVLKASFCEIRTQMKGWRNPKGGTCAVQVPLL
jgi:hypothetical protein